MIGQNGQPWHKCCNLFVVCMYIHVCTVCNCLHLPTVVSLSHHIGLYNVAHETTRGSMDTHFPRLGQMIIDYDAPIKKMTEEFIPLSKVCNTMVIRC